MTLLDPDKQINDNSDSTTTIKTSNWGIKDTLNKDFEFRSFQKWTHCNTECAWILLSVQPVKIHGSSFLIEFSKDSGFDAFQEEIQHSRPATSSIVQAAVRLEQSDKASNCMHERFYPQKEEMWWGRPRGRCINRAIEHTQNQIPCVCTLPGIKSPVFVPWKILVYNCAISRWRWSRKKRIT